jgi:NADPH:quinone reductase-like Zn-dependent oxidoreductase
MYGYHWEERTMKAAVVHGFGETPRCEDFPEPEVEDGDLRVRVEAAVLETFDRLTVRGGHYASRHLFPRFPAVVGHSGVGTLEDGTRVAFAGLRPPHGAMAEVAVVPREHAAHVPRVPVEVDPATAAALPAAAMTSLLPLRYGAGLEPGQTVLVNGATGVAGQLAVQVAGLLGAGRIVGTGRNRAVLAELPGRGATAVIDLAAPEDEVAAAFAHQATDGIDVVLDYIWGRPTELLLRALVPSQVGLATRRVRIVAIGEAAGPTVALRADMLRTSGVELRGAGLVDPAVLPEAATQVWEWLRAGALHVGVDRVPLRDVADAWDRPAGGRRVVIVP